MSIFQSLLGHYPSWAYKFFILTFSTNLLWFAKAIALLRAITPHSLSRVIVFSHAIGFHSFFLSNWEVHFLVACHSNFTHYSCFLPWIYLRYYKSWRVTSLLPLIRVNCSSWTLLIPNLLQFDPFTLMLEGYDLINKHSHSLSFFLLSLTYKTFTDNCTLNYTLNHNISWHNVLSYFIMPIYHSNLLFLGLSPTLILLHLALIIPIVD